MMSFIRFASERDVCVALAVATESTSITAERVSEGASEVNDDESRSKRGGVFCGVAVAILQVWMGSGECNDGHIGRHLEHRETREFGSGPKLRDGRISTAVKKDGHGHVELSFWAGAKWDDGIWKGLCAPAIDACVVDVLSGDEVFATRGGDDHRG
jgi:hypothetical protein